MSHLKGIVQPEKGGLRVVPINHVQIVHVAYNQRCVHFCCKGPWLFKLQKSGCCVFGGICFDGTLATNSVPRCSLAAQPCIDKPPVLTRSWEHLKPSVAQGSSQAQSSKRYRTRLVPIHPCRFKQGAYRYTHVTSVADPASGSRIQCLFDPWIRDLGPYFRELGNNFVG